MRKTPAKPTGCELCGRKISLTFHHLIPKKLHRRNFYRKHFTKEVLNTGVFLCRPCHSFLHKKFDEKTLAVQLNTLQKLQENETIAAHSVWLAKQRRH